MFKTLYSLATALLVASSSASEITHPNVESAPLATITDKIFMDISVNGTPFGRIVFGLFGDVVPKTVENFKGLSACDHGQSKTDKTLDLCYKGSIFHRIIPGFMAQGGDF